MASTFSTNTDPNTVVMGGAGAPVETYSPVHLGGKRTRKRTRKNGRKKSKSKSKKHKTRRHHRSKRKSKSKRKSLKHGHKRRHKKRKHSKTQKGGSYSIGPFTPGAGTYSSYGQVIPHSST